MLACTSVMAWALFPSPTGFEALFWACGGFGSCPTLRIECGTAPPTFTPTPTKTSTPTKTPTPAAADLPPTVNLQPFALEATQGLQDLAEACRCWRVSPHSSGSTWRPTKWV